tara:strand:- start:7342 stop:7608 length:267 start_codon:yes stop_codon:yes gene_type:complete
MQDLLLTLEKNKFYQELVASLAEEDKAQFMTDVSQMAKMLNELCNDFDDLMNKEEGTNKFMEALGSAINRRAFHDNNGVTEVPWPEKN